MRDLLHRVMTAKVDPIESVAAWWDRHRAIALAYPEPILAAIACAAGTDRLGWAFGSGYQCAGRALVRRSFDGIAALCATESAGAHPRNIETRLERGLLFGTKSFVTFGMDAEVLIVIASEGHAPDGRNLLRAVLVDRGAPGVEAEPFDAAPFVPEISHASIRFDGAAGTLLDGDGYLSYLKPFRTIEDTHVMAAAIAHAVTLSLAGGFANAFAEPALAALLSLVEIARMPPLDPVTHLALAGALESTRALAEIVDARATGLPKDLADRWSRDRALFGVAEKARHQRRTSAWLALMDRR
jgi:hypothetical protein